MTNLNDTSKNHTSIVVGGGIAGIAAALALAKHGVKVTLIEGRSRLGGRAGSFTSEHPASGQQRHIDYCQHVGMGCCTNLKQLIEWLGQTDDWQTHRQLHFFGPSGDYQKLSAWPLLPAPLHLCGWLLHWPGLKLRDRACIARGLWSINQLKLDEATQALSAQAWLSSQGQTAVAINNFWTTIIVSALGEELSQVSLCAVAKVLQDGFLRHRQAFHLLVPTRPLGELFGSRAEDELRKHFVTIHKSCPVSAIHDWGAESIRVTCRQQSFTADSLVLAVPWHQLAKIDYGNDPAGLMQLSRNTGQLRSSAITGIHTWWDRRWLDLPHAAIVGRLCQWVFPKTNAASSDNSCVEGAISAAQVRSAFRLPAEHYYQIVISASRGLRGGNPDELAKQIHDDLGHVFPSVRAARLIRCQIVTDPQAVFSISPESYTLRPPTQITPRWMLAGDWTSTGWPATMEGASLSGFRAAQQLLHLSHDSPPNIVCPPLASS